MNQERNKILDKAKKLKELADRGIGGEKENAKVMLEKYMLKHNITMNEIQGHTINDSSYGNMSDEEFYKVMLSEIIALGVGFVFSKVMKLNFNTEKHFNDLSDKYTKAVKDRTNKHKH
jgi:hypothetical protein